MTAAGVPKGAGAMPANYWCWIAKGSSGWHSATEIQRMMGDAITSGAGHPKSCLRVRHSHECDVE
jgi:hypothetical protein